MGRCALDSSGISPVAILPLGLVDAMTDPLAERLREVELQIVCGEHPEEDSGLVLAREARAWFREQVPSAETLEDMIPGHSADEAYKAATAIRALLLRRLEERS